MVKGMHPALRSFLEGAQVLGVETVDSLSTLNRHATKILSAITGVYRSARSAEALMGGGYVITGDALLKVLLCSCLLRVTAAELGCHVASAPVVQQRSSN